MEGKYREFIEKFQKTKNKIKLDQQTTMRVGGDADLFLVIGSSQELIKAVTLARKLKIPYFILGGGSNIIFSDKGFRGLIIKIKNQKSKIKNNKIIAEAGALMSELVRLAADHKLSGLEWATGLPGTLGGAIYGNAGSTALGKEIRDSFVSAKILLPSGKVRNVDRNWFEFGYRTSKIKVIKSNNKPIILEAVLGLKKDKPKLIIARMKEVITRRSSKLPKGFSAGCIFKNIDARHAKIAQIENSTKKMISAGYLIDLVGLKGKKVGGVIVSKQHANFIINKNKGKASDIKELVKIIKKEVYDKFGLKLVTEVEFVRNK